MQPTDRTAISRTTRCLLVAVGPYQSPALADLRYPARQAAELKAALCNPHGCAISPENITVLLDKDATRANVLTSLRSMAAMAEQTAESLRDTLLFFFAGHGVTASDRFYLCSCDTDPQDLDATAVSSLDLQQILGASAARGVLVILDCCEGASFAETAPALFARLDGSDYRILISASQADQPSLECDGVGTLFTKNLIAILNGRIIAGSTPGQIYLADLLRALRDGINEDIERELPQLRMQEPVFVGVYPREPLLFVHHGLNERKPIQTFRYSGRYVRRLVKRALGGVFLAILFVMGTWRAVLDSYEYASLEGDTLLVWDGHPRWNALGYPRLTWSFRADRDGFVDTSDLRRSGLTVSALNEPVLQKVLPQMTATRRALYYHWVGDSRAARQHLLVALDSQETTPAERQLAASTLVGIATPADAEAVGQMVTANQPDDVLQHLVATLARIAPDDAIRMLSDDSRLNEPPFHSAALMHLSLGDADLVHTYLTDLLETGEGSRTATYVIDASLRLGLTLDSDDLFAGVLNVRSSFDIEDLVNYGRVVAGANVGSLVTEFLRAAVTAQEFDEFEVYNALRVYAASPGAGLVEDLGRLEGRLQEFTRTALYEALLNAANDGAGVRPPLTRRFVPLHFKYGLMDPVEANRWIDRDNEAECLMAILESGEERYLGLARERLTADYAVTRRLAMRVLRRYGADFEGQAGLSDVDASVQRIAHEWLLDVDEDEGLDALFGRLGDGGWNYVAELLAQRELNEARMQRLRRLVVDARVAGTSEVGEPTLNAVRVLAVRGTVDEVLDLLSDRRRSVRNAALEYVGGNPVLAEIAEAFVMSAGRPAETEGRLLSTLEMRAELLTSVMGVPEEMRFWRGNRLFQIHNPDLGIVLWLRRLLAAEEAASASGVPQE